MLQKSSWEEITKLRLAPGKEVSVLAIVDLAPGTVIRVSTASGDCYFFEITDPQKYRAHMVRCDSRGGADSAGYRGELVVSALFRIGDPILHGGKSGVGYTSAVAGITILEKEVEK
jgi:hypothetical protein